VPEEYEPKNPHQYVRTVHFLRHGPLTSGDELLKVPVARCAGCGRYMLAGEFYAFVPIGPGPDKANREACAGGKVFKHVSVVVHWACATGGE
jgi:hypothetical protein